MQAVKIKITAWDNEKLFSPKSISLELGDRVIVKADGITDIGEVVGFENVESTSKDEEDKEAEEQKDQDANYVVRKANSVDIKKIFDTKEKIKSLEFCKKIKEKYDLPMKFVDVHFSFDGSRIIFAFIAEGRVDFREMVKDLTRHFGKTIRLQQIGIRDEAKIMGDVGHCGKQLCCRTHLRELASITSEMAELQQCSHRGSDRISGICGRLFCCMAYEQKGYEDFSKTLPVIGARVNVDGKRGEIVGRHMLKQTVDVKFPGENGSQSTVVEIDINRRKKK